MCCSGKVGAVASTSTAATATVESNGAPKRKITDVTLPLQIGTTVLCRWRDDKYHRVSVLQRRNLPSGGDDDYEYYVHYPEFDRRLDEWVKIDQLDLDSAEFAEKPRRGRKKKKTGEHVEYVSRRAEKARKHEELTMVKNIERIELGKYEIETWYFSPFPPGFRDCSKLYFCEFCLRFMMEKEKLQNHLKKCKLKHPPGDEIYRNGSISVFEVDGRKEKTYGENLCYLSKLFLDHKSLLEEVHIFLFYILCECDDRGCHIVGYFSKEKQPDVCEERPDGYNLACILTLPPYQRKGYGNFLISFSYELSKKEKKVGTPETPLSDLGMVSYRGYWTRVLLGILKEQKDPISIMDLVEKTAILPVDVANTLEHLGLILYKKGNNYLCGDPEVLDRILKRFGSGGLPVDVDKIIWTPYS